MTQLDELCDLMQTEGITVAITASAEGRRLVLTRGGSEVMTHDAPSRMSLDEIAGSVMNWFLRRGIETA